MTPDELYRCLADAYNAGDLDAMVACYDPNAAFVIPPGRVTQGPAELRAALRHGLELHAHLAITPASFTQSGDVILVVGTWTLRTTRADGSPLERSAHFADILRHQPDGRWLIAVDHPRGGEPPPTAL